MKQLKISKLNDGRQILESSDRYYLLSEVKTALNENALSFADATEDDLLYVIDEGLVESEGVILNEVRYDWSRIDPITGMPAVAERPEDKIHLMNQLPGRSGWIVLLQNRVNLNSVGNIRSARKMWYDRTDRTLSSDPDKTDAVYFRRYVLPNAGYPQGWIEPEVYTKLTNRNI